MQDQPTSSLAASRFNLIAGRFRLLNIDPTATRAQVEQAYAIARKHAAVPDEALAAAREGLLDPAQRLLSELAYPLDSTDEQVNAFNADLSGNSSASELWPAANNLPPLSRANFLALLAARHIPDTNLLVALVDAHAATDDAAIFEILKARRSRAGFPTPSLIDIRQGLQELQNLHREVIIAAYSTVQSAARSLVECVRQIGSDDRYRIDALSGLLKTYRRSLTNSHTNDQIDAALNAIKERPEEGSLIKLFEKALNDWISPIVPLVLLNAHQNRSDEGLDKVLAGARGLLADLIAQGDYERAREIATICFNALNQLPGLFEPFQETALALEYLSLETKNRALEQMIQTFSRGPQSVVAAIELKGFGTESTGPALTLWKAFTVAVAASHPTERQERPWMSIRGLAFNLHARPESARAASILISDLLRFGEALPAAPAILGMLRNDQSMANSSNNPATAQPNSPIPSAKAALFIILAALMLSAFFALREFNPSFLRSGGPTHEQVPKQELQAIPPPSKGERFKLEFVRYCHFQEERLRILKLHVKGTEDIQAYNMLANDYNSRCSNFYYLDEDLKVVTEEVKAKKQILEAEAMRILSTWPWHAATSDNSTPPSK